MKTSQKGIDLIKKYEGCVLEAYKDPVGVWTIGYGHTTGVKEGQKITQEEADELLLKDIETHYKRVMKYDDIYHFNQNQIDALTSFCFNIGNIDQLTNKGKRTIEEISEKILAYNKAGGKVLAGLTRRRKAEKALFDEALSEAKEDIQESNTGLESPVASEAKEKQEKTQEVYIVGNVYTITVKTALNVRKGAGKNYALVGYNNLTQDGKNHATKFGALLPGTKVTCKDVRKYSDTNIWIKIPSGWICAIEDDKTFVK